MDFIVAAHTDKGIVKETNQDSYSLQVVKVPDGRVVFAVLCDGMGGLSMGEIASATVVHAFEGWFAQSLLHLYHSRFNEHEIFEQWRQLLATQNRKLQAYGRQKGVNLGTTATILLLAQDRYIIAHVGDTRVYEIRQDIRQLTRDQTLVQRELEWSRITPAQAEVDTRRSVLLQCVGASAKVVPECLSGRAAAKSIYLLCSDGFRHEVKASEMLQSLRFEASPDAGRLQAVLSRLTQENMRRGERDNITSLAVCTV